MRVIAKKTLRDFYEQSNFSDAKGALEAWHAEVIKAVWKNTNDIKEKYRSASFVGDKVVFNICGNKYRLIVKIDYVFHAVFIKFIGTHKEYDKLDVKDL
ncbi:MAG: type II toxin-antitoxin system HigB family toxin [Campylobacter sp.]|nr:type II toxin-antitoxin system HigB family toxin [Campylobacter sp.]